MTRPSTIAAIAVLACVPALLAFASGEMSLAGLLARYLVALVVVSVGSHVLMHLWNAYASGDNRRGGEGRPDQPADR